MSKIKLTPKLLQNVRELSKQFGQEAYCIPADGKIQEELYECKDDFSSVVLGNYAVLKPKDSRTDSYFRSNNAVSSVFSPDLSNHTIFPNSTHVVQYAGISLFSKEATLRSGLVARMNWAKKELLIVAPDWHDTRIKCAILRAPVSPGRTWHPSFFGMSVETTDQKQYIAPDGSTAIALKGVEIRAKLSSPFAVPFWIDPILFFPDQAEYRRNMLFALSDGSVSFIHFQKASGNSQVCEAVKVPAEMDQEENFIVHYPTGDMTIKPLISRRYLGAA